MLDCPNEYEIHSVKRLSDGEVFSVGDDEEHYGKIVSDIQRTMYGYEILKTIAKLSEPGSGQDYFELLVSSLKALDDAAIDLGAVRLWFGLNLLKISGHMPELNLDNKGQKLSPDSKYSLSLDDMAFALNGTYGSGHIKLLRLAARLDSPKPLSLVKDIDKVLSDCLALVNAMTRQYLV